MSLRQVDNVAFTIESGFANSYTPVSNLTELDDYSITTDRSAYLNFIADEGAYIHIRIATTAST